LPPPSQVNEIQNGDGSQPARPAAGRADSNAADTTSSSQQGNTNDDVDKAIASSKHKKKKGLRKIVPF